MKSYINPQPQAVEKANKKNDKTPSKQSNKEPATLDKKPLNKKV